VERIFPLHSPRYERIDVLTRGDVRHNRLFYLRQLRGKASRVDTQEELEPGTAAAPPPAAEPAAEAAAVPAAPEGKKGKAGKAAAAPQG
jgi:large subunit ribosomal protein L19